MSSNSLKVKIDVDSLAKQFGNYAVEIKEDLMKGVQRLAAATKAHVVEQAEQELTSATFLKFEKNVGLDDVAPGIWVVSIDEEALWIEEGIEPNFDMKPGLLKNAKKTSKDGYKYQVIPFDQGKSKTSATGYEFNLRERVRTALKKEKIPFKKIENDPNGNPRLGLLHRINIRSEIPGKGNTPVLQGVSVYQTLTQTGNVRRDIMTFRTVSGGPASAGKWFHPGYDAKKFLDRAQAWAENEWEQTILPMIMDKYGK
jgi:hypothetical protein